MMIGDSSGEHNRHPHNDGNSAELDPAGKGSAKGVILKGFVPGMHGYTNWYQTNTILMYSLK